MASRRFSALASTLAGVGRRFYARGWVLGTSGNFSAVVSRDPLELAISASGTAKGEMRPADVLRCDDRGRAIGRTAARPSAETLLHLQIVRQRGAAAVLHTHSIWGTMLSDLFTSQGGLAIAEYEMLKGLAGVASHEHREWVPILDNDQDMTRLARQVEQTLSRHPDAHAFLLRRHGLYTWGGSLAEAERHVEILEFLFETIGRTRADGMARPRAEAGDGDRAHA
jgi:methylthioribulose-1-phosphate dehydratase